MLHIVLTLCHRDCTVIVHSLTCTRSLPHSYLRHPSYFGWFYWSVGTQLLLCNPLCTAAYAYAAWTFFSGRIPYEEALLVDFYGAEYVQYARSTVIGIPGIAGHVRSAVTAQEVAGWLRGDKTGRASATRGGDTADNADDNAGDYDGRRTEGGGNKRVSRRSGATESGEDVANDDIVGSKAE